MMMVVTWSFPTSWKSQDSYYKLMYEIKYKPLRSSHEQVCASRPVSCWVFMHAWQFLSMSVCVYFSQFSSSMRCWLLGPETINRQVMTVLCVFTCLSYLYVSMQIMTLNNQRSYTITDAMPGVEYLIQLRTKDEYDGQWSDWSTPVNACSWTGRHTRTHAHTHTHVERKVPNQADSVISRNFKQVISSENHCMVLEKWK